ncbi:hypothetical protein OS127_02875 [Corynebacterium sp. P6129]|uniref:hypothetical protein n=1 Tax=Corynebacterium antarcticum TaxID=2800405 RepID=UPI002260EE0B|nr:hypothetical protein [Corynebacterium antarcticum]MCX7491473.1 hypothetical protein [Corynebacterium antarcticum]
MTEQIKVVVDPVYNESGFLVSDPVDRVIDGVSVWPRGSSRVEDRDVDGFADELEIAVPAGHGLSEGDEVIVRGHAYKILFRPFDWAQGRRPINPQHRPRTVLVATRKEG